MADGGEGLRVIDIGVPTAMREVGYLDTPGEYYHAVVLNTGHALIADSGGGE